MNTNQRGPKMDQTVIMRCTYEDKAAMIVEAKQRGKNLSQMIRELLIENKIIPPQWTPTHDNF